MGGYKVEGYGEFIAVEFTFVAWIREGPRSVRGFLE